jgi:hypothetical protein
MAVGLMGIYEDMQKVATGLLTEFDQGSITLTRNSRAAGPNAWTPGSDTPTVYNLNGAVRGVSRRYINGRSVLESDLQATVAVEATNASTEAKLAITPDPKTDFMTVDGRRHEIISYEKLPAAGTAAALVIIMKG